MARAAMNTQAEFGDEYLGFPWRGLDVAGMEGEQLEYWLRYAVGVYGAATLGLLHPSELSRFSTLLLDDKAAFLAYTGLPPDALLQARMSSGVLRPAYALAVDDRMRRVVLAVR
eukprot:CAMPEP_0113711040 /NCGR_PEP_ID=MMETSP0038_2-20120614/30520_1 /TAXON_ID=2898 /ORGANISM="Cryptomonas paramecium" /LENGTH=113 /DNA_ID=CAMNT_0000637221 /DNA_START=629 /DNA_END=967 /DNA_ORIENTATION=- /assembly_acc=CAM_ASM_000170